jgi:simple sugar transport system permease protein
MVIFNPANAWAGFLVMLQGGFTDGMRGVGQVLYNATPLILVGIAVGFSFQTGVFNIGAIGQFTAGAYVAIAVGGILKGLTGPFHWLISLVAAGVVGVVWAILPGIMKAYMRISEIITCIMMNYVAVYLVNQLVYITHYDKTTVQSARVMRTALMPKLGLNKIFAGSSVNSGLFIAIAIAVVAYLILYKTTYGYSLRACGLNPFASRYAGINEKLNTLSVMMISGLAAGLGGGVLYLSSLTKNYVLTENFITEASYGIPVALLGNSHPIGIIFSSLFIAFIMVGGSLMQGNGFPVETVDIITAIIVYFSAVAPLFKLLINKGILNIGLKWAKGEGKAREVDN